MSSSRNLWLTLTVMAAIILAMVGSVWVSYRFVKNQPAGIGFESNWTAAHRWVTEGTSPYSLTGLKTDQQLLWQRVFPSYKDQPAQYFLYPLYSMLFFAPLGTLDLDSARVAGMTILAGTIIFSCLIVTSLIDWKPSSRTLIAMMFFTLFGYTSISAIQAVDITLLSGFLIFASFLLIKNNREIDAGLVMAMSTIQLQAVYPVIIFTLLWAISTKRLKLLVGLFGGIAFLMIISMAFLPQWPVQWFYLIVNLPASIRPSFSIAHAAGSAMPALSQPMTIGVTIFSAGYLLIEWIICWGRDFKNYIWTAFLTIVLSGFFIPQETLASQLLYLPVLYLMMKTWQDRWGLAGKISSWVFLAGFFAGIWALALFWKISLDTSSLLILFVPVASLFALWWSRWWMMRAPKLYFDQYSG